MVDSDNRNILELFSVNFRYPNGNKEVILEDITLNVREAEIYGLLGASGCGKTTLLRLILGQLSPSNDDAKIILFNNFIDSKHRPLPSDIGYMPQDIVLYQDFTSLEMLQYFGRLQRMSPADITERIDQLIRLLEMDHNDNQKKLIKHLSGGQRRRISLAIALLHQPSLLILDEPTVGLDPLLREVIWNHLSYLTKQKRNTVILTTHYIEEARNAQTIGFLRQGHLLVQSEPEKLLWKYQTNTLEDVFLQLCRQNEQIKQHEQQQQQQQQQKKKSTEAVVISIVSDLFEKCKMEKKGNSKKDDNDCDNEDQDDDDDRFEKKKFNQIIEDVKETGNRKEFDRNNNNNNNNRIQPWNGDDNNDDGLLKPEPDNKNNKKKVSIFQSKILLSNKIHHNNHHYHTEHFVCWPHLWTLMMKNYRQIYRNWSLLMFFILLPSIEIALIMMCIGRDIKHIPIAIYNGEGSNADLSQIFLDSFQSDAFIFLHFDSSQQAYQAVKQNKAAGILQFSPNFSTALRSRFFSFGYIDDDNGSGGGGGFESTAVWNDSSVYVQLDMSNQLIGLQIQRNLLTAFLNFAQHLAISLGFGNHTFKPPISFGPPVYGIETTAVVETFIAPGALIMIAFFATTIVSCHLLINEIRQDLIERAMISGASSAEFLFSHVAIQTSILMIQLLLVLLTAFHLFQMPYLGSLPLSIALICLQGMCGLMYGLMLSATCPDEIYATTLAIGTFFPSVIIGGIFWPVQSMPTLLQYLSQCLPSTQSIDALRFILLRNWNLNHTSVASAFIVSTLWLLVFMFSALRNFKKQI